MIWIGTSGFQYPEWKGIFYPEKMAPAKMLAYYAGHFPTTEINYTFRRLPSDKTLANWIAQTPAQFRFTLKAPEVITHHQRLKDSGAIMERFAEAALKLGDKRGALLFQLPPYFKCDSARLEDFLAAFPKNLVPAFEFRHASWFADEVFETLRKHQAVLCIADTEELTTPKVFTSDRTAYFRLRRVHYTKKELQEWADVISKQTPRLADIYVYFKHEEAGTGPKLGKELMKLLGPRHLAE
ncbi:MAG: hypothetical protein K0Q55_3933 [Verrucomicrobia bacterium]|jgi:uncharacterized protein YecE (DUF72 family)|nr:hypothetical protein [Verrucomicrobiota bacterium]